MGNVAFRGDEAVVLIDFDLAGANDPLREIPALSFCVPAPWWTAQYRAASTLRGHTGSSSRDLINRLCHDVRETADCHLQQPLDSNHIPA